MIACAGSSRDHEGSGAEAHVGVACLRHHALGTCMLVLMAGALCMGVGIDPLIMGGRAGQGRRAKPASAMAALHGSAA